MPKDSLVGAKGLSEFVETKEGVIAGTGEGFDDSAEGDAGVDAGL